MEVKPALSNFEKERQARIAENKKLLATLQIEKAVNALQEHCTKANAKQCQPKAPSAKAVPRITRGRGALRRSGRLKGKAPIYNEERMTREIHGLKAKKTGRRHSRDVTREEIYTEKHVQLLGSYEKEWELFVDGYDHKGVRIYDATNGKTCHQCRQKTMGKHSSCSKCKKLCGCFCGDCLFMRYGENLDEVNEKTDWICPVCRDICNCSFCRIAKGWAPTGALYRKAKAEGYKSVAHYLILQNLQDKENVSPPDPSGEKESSSSDGDKENESNCVVTRFRNLRPRKR